MITCSTCSTHNPEGKSVCSSCGTALQAAPPSATLPPNSSLKGGAFKIASVLGQGGFGITYKGGDMGLKRYVAIKELFPQGSARNGLQVVPTSSSDQLSFDRDKAGFLKEAQTLARFNHPGIVRVFTSFEENNTAYMVMEYLQGQTLQQRLEQQGVLSEKETLQLARQVGEALSMVHQGGLLHRDIKPDNILLTDEGRAVLIDFGTARAFASNKTVRQTAMLTPGYAPLEQYGQQARFGVPCDVYALGATLYHCLTGQLPPPATDRATGVDLQPPDQVNPRLSPDVSRAVMWAMEMKADARPQTMKAFIDVLHGAAQAQPSAPQTSTLYPASVEPAGPSHPSVPQPGQSSGGWHFNVAGGTHGPVDQSAVSHLVRTGRIREDTMVWREGMPDWTQAKLTELGSLFRGGNHHLPTLPAHTASSSGQGEASSPLPAELKRFNWGAFLIGWAWGLAHGAPWTLVLLIISFIPRVNFLVFPASIALGFLGNAMAWKNREWDSIEQFKTVQRTWVIWGVAVLIITVFVFSRIILAELNYIENLFNQTTSNPPPFDQ